MWFPSIYAYWCEILLKIALNTITITRILVSNIFHIRWCSYRRVPLVEHCLPVWTLQFTPDISGVRVHLSSFLYSILPTLFVFMSFSFRHSIICLSSICGFWYYIFGILDLYSHRLARSFNFTFRYIDDVLSLNNSRFGDFVDRIYPIELEIKDTTDTDRSASYLDIHLEIDSEGWLRT